MSSNCVDRDQRVAATLNRHTAVADLPPPKSADLKFLNPHTSVSEYTVDGKVTFLMCTGCLIACVLAAPRINVTCRQSHGLLKIVLSVPTMSTCPFARSERSCRRRNGWTPVGGVSVWNFILPYESNSISSRKYICHFICRAISAPPVSF